MTKKELLEIIEGFMTSQCTGKRKRKSKVTEKYVYILVVKASVIKKAYKATGRNYLAKYIGE